MYSNYFLLTEKEQTMIYTCHVNIVTNLVMSHEWGKDREVITPACVTSRAIKLESTASSLSIQEQKQQRLLFGRES
jgi:hypothetical protein